MITTNRFKLLVLIVSALLLSSCASPGVPGAKSTASANAVCTIDRSRAHERLYGVLWVQTSADYQVATRGAFRQARSALDVALADPSHTAALEQMPPFAHKPPAVIMDIDETVLDNSPFAAQLVLEGTDYNRDTWGAWMKKAGASWVPGSKKFIDYAASKKVAVIFVTNRSKEEEATRGKTSIR